MNWRPFRMATALVVGAFCLSVGHWLNDLGYSGMDAEFAIPGLLLMSGFVLEVCLLRLAREARIDLHGRPGFQLWSMAYNPIARLEEEWEYAQANDGAIWAAEAQKDRIAVAQIALDESPNEALPMLLSLADGGSVGSMLLLGWCFSTGRGAVQNWVEAERWYRSAYSAGSQRALLYLGSELELRGYSEAQEDLYTEGALRDWPPAVFRLAKLRLRFFLSPEKAKAVRVQLGYAAAAGSPEAQWWLAWFSLRGCFGLWRIVPGHFEMWALIKGRLVTGQATAPLAPVGAASEAR